MSAAPPPVRPFRLVLRDVQVHTRAGWASPPCSFEANPGDFCLLTGPGGSGKTLLIERIAGVMRPETSLRGRLSLNTTGSGGGPPRVAHVPQDARLGALPTDRVRTLFERTAGAASWLEKVGLEADRMLDLELRTLAMSERRRVLLAAALARPFELLLFDGYGESLDPSARGRCLDLLEDACASGRAVLLTSRERHPAGITPTRTVDCLHEAADAGTAVPLLRRAKPGTRRPHAHPLLEAEHVWVTRGRRGLLGRLPAATPVADASLFVRHGEVVVLLGPSASGKTTFLETMAGLRPPVRGQIRVSGVEVVSPRSSHLRRLRREVQLVFQDAAGVLDAGRTVHAHLDEAKQLGRGEAQSAEAWLDRLGLPERLLEAPADVLSASEAARVDLARSLAVKPLMVLLDEPRDLGIGEDDGVVLSVIDAEKKAGTSFLVATSEPEVAATLADRIAIFAAGRVIELGSREDVLACPAHPLTRAFLTDQSSRRFDPRRVPPGCAFSGACEREGARCSKEAPPLLLVPGREGGSHRAACFYPLGAAQADIAPSIPPPDTEQGG